METAIDDGFKKMKCHDCGWEGELFDCEYYELDNNKKDVVVWHECPDCGSMNIKEKTK